MAAPSSPRWARPKVAGACFLVAGLQALALPAFAEEVTIKNFDDGRGGHHDAIWVDGKPYWYSDYGKKTAPAKSPKSAKVPAKDTAAAPAEAPAGNTGGESENPGSEDQATGAKPESKAPAADAGAARQSKSAARATTHMHKMAAAMKSMQPGDAGPSGAQAARDAGARMGTAPAAGPPAPLPLPPADAPRALERRPDFFSVITPEKYAGLKKAYVLTGGSAQPAFRDIGSTGRDFVWSKSCTKGLEPCNPLAAGKDASRYQKNAEVSPETLINISQATAAGAEEDLSPDEVAKIYAAMKRRIETLEAEERVEPPAASKRTGPSISGITFEETAEARVTAAAAVRALNASEPAFERGDALPSARPNSRGAASIPLAENGAEEKSGRRPFVWLALFVSAVAVMAYRRWVSAAVVALLLAAPAAARDALTPGESKLLLASWNAALAELDSGRDLAGFLKKQPVEIRVDRRLASAGLYEAGRIYIHAGLLAHDLDLIEEKGPKGDEAVNALAWAWLPILAHEVEHARTRHAFELIIGTPYAYVDRDDEFLCFIREARISREMHRRHPKRLRMNDLGTNRRDTLAYFLKLGPGDFTQFEAAMTGIFRSAPQLRLMDREQLKVWALDNHEYWRKEERKRRAQAAAPVAAVIQDIERRQAEEAATAASRAKHVIDLTSDARRFTHARGYFEARVEQARLAWPDQMRQPE